MLILSFRRTVTGAGADGSQNEMIVVITGLDVTSACAGADITCKVHVAPCPLPPHLSTKADGHQVARQIAEVGLEPQKNAVMAPTKSEEKKQLRIGFVHPDLGIGMS